MPWSLVTCTKLFISVRTWTIRCVRSGLWLCSGKNLGLGLQMANTSRHVPLEHFYCRSRLLVCIWIKCHIPRRTALRIKWCVIHTEIIKHYIYTIFYIFTLSESHWLKLHSTVSATFGRNLFYAILCWIICQKTLIYSSEGTWISFISFMVMWIRQWCQGYWGSWSYLPLLKSATSLKVMLPPLLDFVCHISSIFSKP